MRKDETFQRVKISVTEYDQLKRAERKVKSAKVLKRINEKAPFGCKSIVAKAEHWMVPIS